MTKKLTIVLNYEVSISNLDNFKGDEIEEGFKIYKEDLIREINKVDLCQGIFMLESIEVVSVTETTSFQKLGSVYKDFIKNKDFHLTFENYLKAKYSQEGYWLKLTKDCGFATTAECRKAFRRLNNQL